MYFVTGGAFNGKRAWVKKHFPKSDWISAYCGDSLPEIINSQNDIVVLEGIEKWIKEELSNKEKGEVRSKWRKLVEELARWEKEKEGRKVIFIGTDISKGIVPLEEENRAWRDVTGWVYQDLAAACEQVQYIWYGLNKLLKGEKG